MRVSCHYCNKALPKTAPRLVLNGHWTCEDCAYLIDHPDAKRIEPPLRVNPKRPRMSEGNERETYSAATKPEDDQLERVYCEHCHKTHVVSLDEEECAPGAWRLPGERWPTDA